MRILVVCGMGLGSSHFVMMNTLKLIKKYKIDAVVENCDLFSAGQKEADIYIGADYLIDQLEVDGRKIRLEDLVDENELEKKLRWVLNEFEGVNK